ncbi:hypothetical protein CEXT_41201 [Caerostris extrusa]|uniref:Uncharacterized protein n=1 Tax=Caerostris extrusa TaxID=172846 RepID=A0AAV4S0C6_CAEEX|nr:hypothetical protein CEXT_41201 [Caerostris extrusa]
MQEERTHLEQQAPSGEEEVARMQHGVGRAVGIPQSREQSPAQANFWPANRRTLPTFDHFRTKERLEVASHVESLLSVK